MSTAEEIEKLMPDTSQLLSIQPEMESPLYYTQLNMLVTGLEWWWRDREDFFIGANLTIYYCRQQLEGMEDYLGTDFFVIEGVEKRPRNCWVAWEEDASYPDLVIELMSDSTADVDRGFKKDLYRNTFRVAEYFWFSPDTLEFNGFYLSGSQYIPREPLENGWRWSKVLGLYLAVVDGKLRYVSRDGELVPTPEELATLAQQKIT